MDINDTVSLLADIGKRREEEADKQTRRQPAPRA